MNRICLFLSEKKSDDNDVREKLDEISSSALNTVGFIVIVSVASAIRHGSAGSLQTRTLFIVDGWLELFLLFLLENKQILDSDNGDASLNEILLNVVNFVNLSDTKKIEAIRSRLIRHSSVKSLYTTAEKFQRKKIRDKALQQSNPLRQPQSDLFSVAGACIKKYAKEIETQNIIEEMRNARDVIRETKNDLRLDIATKLLLVKEEARLEVLEYKAKLGKNHTEKGGERGIENNIFGCRVAAKYEKTIDSIIEKDANVLSLNDWLLRGESFSCTSQNCDSRSPEGFCETELNRRNRLLEEGRNTLSCQHEYNAKERKAYLAKVVEMRDAKKAEETERRLELKKISLMLRKKKVAFQKVDMVTRLEGKKHEKERVESLVASVVRYGLT